MKPVEVPIAVSNLFSPQEKLLWAGTPDAGLLALTGFDYFQSICGLAIIAITLAGDFASIGSQKWVFFLLSLPLIIGGLYATVGRLLVSQYFRSNLVYVLTNRSAYIYSRADQNRVMRERITPGLIIQYSPGRRATIRFGKTYHDPFLLQKTFWWPTHMENMEFFRIADGDQVSAQIRKIQEERA